MRAKKKLILSILCLGLALMAAIISITVAVQAKKNVDVKSNITVSYLAKDVWANVKVESVTGSGDRVSTGEEGTITTISPVTNGNASLVSLEPQIYSFGDTGCLILKFSFQKCYHNHSGTDVEPMPDYDIKQLSYTLSNGAPSGFASSGNANVNVTFSTDGTNYSNHVAASTNMLSSVYTITETESWQSYYVKLSVNSKSSDAHFYGTFTWVLEGIPNS